MTVVDTIEEDITEVAMMVATRTVTVATRAEMEATRAEMEATVTVEEGAVTVTAGDVVDTTTSEIGVDTTRALQGEITFRNQFIVRVFNLETLQLVSMDHLLFETEL
jgi:predicted oxidoreductase